MHGSLYVCAHVYRCIGLCMEVYMYVRVFIGVYASDRPILTFYNRYRYRLFIVYLTDNRYSEPIFIYCFKVNK